MSANFCTGCGGPLAAGEPFCPNCGAPIEGEAAPDLDATQPVAVPPPLAVPPPVAPPSGGPPEVAGPSSDPKRTATMVLLGVLGAVALIVIVVGTIALLRSDKGDEDELVTGTTRITTTVPRTSTTAATTTTSTTSTTTTTTTAPPRTTVAPTTVPATPDRTQQAIDDVAARMCDATYITEYRSEETGYELYRVDVHIVLDSGEWWAHFDVDYATEFGPVITPADADSTEMLC